MQGEKQLLRDACVVACKRVSEKFNSCLYCNIF